MSMLRRGGGVCEIDGVELGHAGLIDSAAGALTGTTALILPAGTTGGVDVRGGGPASHETELLAPGTLTTGCDAIVLTGGSAYGLAAAHGVQAGLAADGRGFPAPGLAGVTVPLVPAAGIFDLGRGGAPCLPPTIETGQAAYADRATGPEAVVRGSAGGGIGAWTGRGLLRGGLGSAVIGTDTGHRVAAIAVANPMGTVIAPTGRLHAAEVLSGYGIDLPADDCDALRERLAAVAAQSVEGPPPARNTTIAAVVTDARLDTAQAHRLAQSAHAGLARAIHPSHTLFDGDTVFAAATGAVALTQSEGGSGEADETMVLAQLNIAAADVLSAAIVDAVISAGDYAEGAPIPASPPPLRSVCPDLTAAWEQLD